MSLDLSRKVAAQPWFRWVGGMTVLFDDGIRITIPGNMEEAPGSALAGYPDLARLATLLLVCAQLPAGTWIQERQGWPGQEPGEAALGGFWACQWRRDEILYPWRLHRGLRRETRLEALADALNMLEAK